MCVSPAVSQMPSAAGALLDPETPDRGCVHAHEGQEAAEIEELLSALA
jgi:hypothetical protein